MMRNLSQSGCDKLEKIGFVPGHSRNLKYLASDVIFPRLLVLSQVSE